MFWHGDEPSRLERMCMSSFVAHGHHVMLHVYDAPRGVPQGIELVDATLTLPRSSLFRQRETGSLAAFADWFRYKLLYEQGGIWVDTDVVCLKPFTYRHPEVFAWQDESHINNAVLGLPAGSELAQWMIECCERPNRVRPYDDRHTRKLKRRRRWLRGNRRDDTEWGESGPIGFTAVARHLDRAADALPPWHFYPIHFSDWKSIFDGNAAQHHALLVNSSAVHLWNEMIRREPGFDKHGRFRSDSLFEQWCDQYLKTVD